MNNKEKTNCEKIYEENHKKIHWYLWKYYGWLGEHDTYDVMQEVWKSLSQHIKTVSTMEPAAQWAWLVRVTDSKVITLVRVNARNEKLAQKVEKFYSNSTLQDPVEERIVRKILAEKIFEKLSDKEKRTLFEQHISENSSETQKVRDNAMTCKIYRARKKLQKYMKEGGLDE